MPLADLPVWTIPHDWEEGLLETLDFLTGVLASPIGSEQRFRARLTPRRTFDLTFKLVRERRRLFDEMMNAIGGLEFWMPVWHDPVRTNGFSLAGQNKFIADVSNTDFSFSSGVYIPIGDVFNYAILPITLAEGDGITVEDPLTQTWPRGTLMYPIIRVAAVDLPSVQSITDEVTTVTMKFRAIGKTFFQGTGDLPIYKDNIVFDVEPNRAESMTFGYANFMAQLDNETGLIARQIFGDVGNNTQAYNFTAKGRQENADLRALLFALGGRQLPLWLPTFNNDFELVGDANLTSTQLVVSRCGYTDMGGPRPGREDIAIWKKDGTKIYREVTNSVLVGDGSTEQLTLDDPLGTILTPFNIKRISFLSLARQDIDSIEVHHLTDTQGVSTVTTVFKTLPAVRVVEPTPPPIPPIVVTFSPTDKGSGIDLSGGDLFAENTESPSVFNAVRATVGKVSGKFYFELIPRFLSNNFTMAGMADSLFPLRGTSMGDIHSIAGRALNQIVGNGVDLAPAFAGMATNVPVGIAVNLNHSPKLIWIKDSNGHYNGDPSANPTTNMGGIDIDWMVLPIYPCVGIASENEIFEGHFGNVMSLTPPTGYTVGIHPD